MQLVSSYFFQLFQGFFQLEIIKNARSELTYAICVFFKFVNDELKNQENHRSELTHATEQLSRPERLVSACLGNT